MATLHSSDIDEDATSAVPARMRVLAFGPTGPDVLAVAAFVLPSVSSRLPLSGDVHVALVEALDRLGMAADRHHRLQLADEARDMFAAYLVAAGIAEPQPRVGATMRGWVVFQDLARSRWALAAAARFWQAELTAVLSTSEKGATWARR